MQGERGGEAVEDDQGRSALLEQSLDVGKDARLGHRLIGLHVEELSELLIRQAERAQPIHRRNQCERASDSTESGRVECRTGFALVN